MKTGESWKKPARYSLMSRVVYILILVLAGCSATKKHQAKEITVFAAASLSDVMTELAESFERENDVAIKLNVAASGTLARQIDQGADADVYLSANKGWMEFLVEKGKTEQTAVFVKNDLVLVSPLDRNFQFQKVDSLLMYTEGKIAIGDPGYVPAGKYAMQVFDYYQLDLDGRLFQCQNARSVLMMVELGELDFGIVYQTDAVQSKKVKVICTFPDESHEPVAYYQGLISEKDPAKKFYDYLHSAEARRVIINYSFITD